ncbi:MAG: DEAD/DEAH box helicase, partial [Gammaproteobacteria bacterium]
MTESQTPVAAGPEFSGLPLAPAVLANLQRLGYERMTPIQAASLPPALLGKDIIAQAKTGSGKTAAFALPLLAKLDPRSFAVQALVLCPTRELAEQVAQEIRRLARAEDNVKVLTLCGGTTLRPQAASLAHGAHVVVGTPGRILDHLSRETLALDGLNTLVLDEADRMLDMGFMPDIQRIINLLPKKRQNLMFSATFSGDIRKLAESFLKDPVSVEVARRNATAENVEQKVYKVDSTDAKRAAVAKLVRDNGLSQVIVFSNTKIGAGRLARQLVQDGLNAAAIHGDKSQQERLATLEAFKRGEIVVLVATDVAARGLDIAELPAVINYDLPYSPEDYVHRIGRTGRAGASGIALSLMTAAEERYLVEIEKLIKRQIPVESLAVVTPPRERGARP